MSNSLSGWNDTIVALSTPPGIGAIGVIRLSGSHAIEIVNTIFPSKDLSAQPTHTAHVGFLKKADRLLDEVVVTIYKAPRSYTGENIAEISCHGSPFIQQQVIEACMQGGARIAKPGEFTQRAFLAGRLDLTQAEAVADLIASNTEAAQQAALGNMRGGFSAALKELREQLIQFSALIELELDFSQEDVEFADRSKLRELVTGARLQTGNLLRSFKLGNVIRNGVSAAIVGRPNAGKSTLLNALLNEYRAIVSEIPGTTRDTIEEMLNIDGIIFRLIDTAGIRMHTTDVIELAGIEKSREKMMRADLVLYLFDATATTAAELDEAITELVASGRPYLLVANKSDQVPGAEPGTMDDNSVLHLSAKTGEGLALLREQMVAQVLEGRVEGENLVVTNARHYRALQEVDSALEDVVNGLDSKLPGDLLALDIRRCLQYLGEITGEITNEDQLDYIFSKFCIGK